MSFLLLFYICRKKVWSAHMFHHICRSLSRRPFSKARAPPWQNWSVRTVETRLSTGIFWSLDPDYAARTSAETWDDGVRAWMKGPLLIPASSNNGERSRDRSGIWFPLQVSKMKTNYPCDLKWWRRKPTTHFHPKLTLSIVCCVKLELMTGKAFKLPFSSPPLSCLRQRQRLKAQRYRASTLTLQIWASTGRPHQTTNATLESKQI